MSNILSKDLNMYLYCLHRPFKVSPEKGVLDVGKSIQVEVGFNPKQTGGCQSHLIIQYETGRSCANNFLIPFSTVIKS